MSAVPVSIQAQRLFYYLRDHGVWKGAKQLIRLYRHMHELRFGIFKGADYLENEYYYDPYAQWGRQRFVVYANLKDYDASDVVPEWRGFLHAIEDVTPIEDPSPMYEWSIAHKRCNLSLQGWHPDYAPPGWLPRIYIDESKSPSDADARKQTWQQLKASLTQRLIQQLEQKDIEATAADLCVLAGEGGLWCIRRVRHSKVDELYAAFDRSTATRPWAKKGGIPVINARRGPSPAGAWVNALKYEHVDWIQVKEKEIEQEWHHLDAEKEAMLKKAREEFDRRQREGISGREANT